MTDIDIIILSYANSDLLRLTTNNALQSLFQSEDSTSINFNVIVIESERSLEPYSYPGTTTIYPQEHFGYHRFMNLGIAFTNSQFVCICNNDLIFHKNWATEILSPFARYSDILSASPVCSYLHPAAGTALNSGLRMGYRVREEIAGWCLFFKRELLSLIGMLDPNYDFWCADNDYAYTLWVLNIKHVLVTSSIVDHLENTTLKTKSPEDQHNLTEEQCIYLEKKWDPKLGEKWIEL
jgi:GT2 family glycosyltransferase